MKKLYQLILAAAGLGLGQIASAQTINWKTLQPTQRHIVHLQAGFNNAFEAGLGYGYHIHSKMPLVLNLEYSMPFGEKKLDDLKTKIGGQLNLVRTKNIFATVKAYGVIRRYKNDFVRMINFGSEFSATGGIYKNKWFAAAEIGFDKAITTHIKHSDLMKEYNPGLESGWYIPTGGNLMYGIQGGYTVNRKNEVFAKMGRSLTQDFQTKPTVPYYVQLGWVLKWGGK